MTTHRATMLPAFKPYVHLSTVYPEQSGVSMQELDEKAVRWSDGQPVVVRCASCAWTYAGTVEQGRDAYRAHRRTHT